MAWESIIDSRDSKWDWLFEGSLALPEGCHIEVNSTITAYHFMLMQGEKTVQSSMVYGGNFYSAKAMARAAVKSLVHRAESTETHRVRWDSNAEAIRMELGFGGNGAIPLVIEYK